MSIDILQRIFVIVVALSLGEAFTQFVANTPGDPKDKFIHWDRLIALVAFLLLLIPFYQGNAQYLYQVYQTEQRPKPYAVFLLVDCTVFTLEAGLFFVMSRALPRIQWRRFYTTVLLILVVDTLWGVFVWLARRQEMAWWLKLNVVFIVIFALILWRCRSHQSKSGPSLALAAIIIRTVADYWTSWQFYFPS